RTRNRVRVQVLPENLTDGLEQTRQTAKVKADLIKAERDFIYQLLRDGKITDEARRRIEYELDLEEASVANRAQDGGGWF
ncbi:MAG TPA: Na+/H+ antiporter, partial [Pseudolabrys sp.]|nr:Na+/H+ antiporter [Pseudolabrys sp.]